MRRTAGFASSLLTVSLFLNISAPVSAESFPHSFPISPSTELFTHQALSLDPVSIPRKAGVIDGMTRMVNLFFDWIPVSYNGAVFGMNGGSLQWKDRSPKQALPAQTGPLDDELFGSAQFLRVGNIRMLAYIWGGSAKNVVQRFFASTPHGGNLQREASAIIVSELLEVYHRLQITHREYTVQDLFDALKKDHRIQYLDKTNALERGLKWLEMQGMPILHSGNAWRVNGLSKDRFFRLNISSWPPTTQGRWQELKGNSGGAAIAARLRLMKDQYHWAWEDMDIHYQTIEDWEQGSEPMEVILERVGTKLGIETAWISHGTSRGELELQAYSKLRPGAYGDNLHELRIAAGLSLRTLSVLSGVNYSSLNNLEVGRIKSLSPKAWPKVAGALGQSPFRLLAGLERKDALQSLASFHERLPLLMLAYGKTEEEVGGVLKLSARAVSKYRQQSVPAPPILRKICVLFDTTPQELGLAKPAAPKSNLVLRKPIYSGHRTIDRLLRKALRSLSSDGSNFEAASQYYHWALYRILAKPSDVSSAIKDRLLFFIEDQIADLQDLFPINLARQTSAFTLPGRSRRFQEYMAKRAKRRWKRMRRPLIVYIIGIGKDGAPTVFDLAEELRNVRFRQLHLIGIDNNPEVLDAANDRLKNERLPRGMQIEFKQLSDFDLSSLLAEGLPPADLIEVSNVLMVYSEAARARAIPRMARGLNANSPLGWLAINTEGGSDTYRSERFNPSTSFNAIQIYGPDGRLKDNFELWGREGNPSKMSRGKLQHQPFPYPGPIIHPLEQAA